MSSRVVLTAVIAGAVLAPVPVGAATEPAAWESVPHAQARKAIRAALKASSAAGGDRVSATLDHRASLLRQEVFLDDARREYVIRNLSRGTARSGRYVRYYRDAGRAWQDNSWLQARINGYRWPALAGRLVSPGTILTRMPLPRDEAPGPLSLPVDETLAVSLDDYAMWMQDRDEPALRSTTGATTTWRLPVETLHTDVVFREGLFTSITTATADETLLARLWVTGRGDMATLPAPPQAPLRPWADAVQDGKVLRESARTAKRRALLRPGSAIVIRDPRLPEGWGVRVRRTPNGPRFFAFNATRSYRLHFGLSFPSTPRGLDASMRRDVSGLGATLGSVWVVDQKGRPPRELRWSHKRHAVLFSIKHGREQYVIPLKRGVRLGTYLRHGTAFCVDVRAAGSRSGVARYDSEVGHAELGRSC